MPTPGLQFHPEWEPAFAGLREGDAVIYTTPVEHGVTRVTKGKRRICLVELKRESCREKQEE